MNSNGAPDLCNMRNQFPDLKRGFCPTQKLCKAPAEHEAGDIFWLILLTFETPGSLRDGLDEHA